MLKLIFDLSKVIPDLLIGKNKTQTYYKKAGTFIF